MDIILLEKVGKLGDLGDRVSVKPGHGRNFLIPTGKAVPATKANVEEFEQRRAELEKAAVERKALAEARAAKLSDIELSIAVKAGDEGKLYGSIGTRDLAELITSAGIEVLKSEVRLPEGPIRQVGEFTVDLQLHADVKAALTLHVVPEE